MVTVKSIIQGYRDASQNHIFRSEKINEVSHMIEKLLNVIFWFEVVSTIFWKFFIR